MQYTVNRGDKGKIELKVDASKVDFEKAYSEALTELSSETKVDGFRPGNVPGDVLESKIGVSKILNAAANNLVSDHLAEIFKKEDIVPIINPKVAIDSLAKGEPFSFTAEIVARPNVKVGDWKKVTAKKIKAKKVTNEDVEKSINNIFAAWKKSQSQSEESRVSDQGEDKLIYDAQGNPITPKNSGGPLTGAQDEIGDNFAKAIGARDLAHLKELVRKDLEAIVADSAEQKFEEEIFAEVLKLVDFEVPDILIDDEVNRMMIRLNQQLTQMKKKMEDFLREENTTVDALRAKWRAQAEKNVKVTLTLDEIGHQNEIKVTKEEIDQAAKGINQANMTPEQKLDMEKYLAVSIFQAKTLDLVKKSIIVA